MKFTVHLSESIKDPDATYTALNDVYPEWRRELEASGLSAAEAAAALEVRTDAVHSALKRWWEYGEYLNVSLDIEFDLDAKTATVLPTSRVLEVPR